MTYHENRKSIVTHRGKVESKAPKHYRDSNKKSASGNILSEPLLDTSNKLILLQLNQILKQAKISKNLKQAVSETIKAINDDNFSLAADLTSVKSFISGFPEDRFNEDSEYNKKVLGESVYSILDDIHHKLAFKTHTIPSGVSILSASGVQNRSKSEFNHPIIKLINKEKAEIHEKAERRWAREK